MKSTKSKSMMTPKEMEESLSNGFQEVGETANTYEEFRHCVEGEEYLKIEIAFGLSVDASECKGDILFYVAGIDFMLTEKEGKIDFNVDSEELESSYYEYHTVGKITHERSFSFKPTLNSSLMQKFLEIEVTDSVRNAKGSLMLSYGKHGAHWRIRLYDEKSDFELTQYAFDCVMEGIPDTFFSASDSKDAEVEVKTRINYPMVYELKGDVPTFFGLPQEFTDIKIAHGEVRLTGDQMLIENAKIIAGENMPVGELWAKVIDPLTGMIVGTGKFNTAGATTIVLSDGGVADTYVIKYGFIMFGWLRYDNDVQTFETGAKPTLSITTPELEYTKDAVKTVGDLITDSGATAMGADGTTDLTSQIIVKNSTQTVLDKTDPIDTTTFGSEETYTLSVDEFGEVVSGNVKVTIVA